MCIASSPNRCIACVCIYITLNVVRTRSIGITYGRANTYPVNTAPWVHKFVLVFDRNGTQLCPKNVEVRSCVRIRLYDIAFSATLVQGVSKMVEDTVGARAVAYFSIYFLVGGGGVWSNVYNKIVLYNALGKNKPKMFLGGWKRPAHSIKTPLGESALGDGAECGRVGTKRENVCPGTIPVQGMNGRGIFLVGKVS